MKNCLTISLFVLLSTGCAQTYTPTDPAKTVSVNITELNDARVLVGNDWQILRPDQFGKAQLTYGQRISVGNYYDAVGYSTEFYCFAKTSFVPAQGKQYFLNFMKQNGKCKLTVLRQTDQNRLGLMPEPTATS